MEIRSSFSPIDIAVSGMKAQNRQIKCIGSNVANAQVTDAGNGEPYRRMEVQLRSNEDGSVSVGDVNMDMSEFTRLLKPGDPRADAQGYVSMPNVSIPTEMINLTAVKRAYEANAAILKRYQKMVETTLELLR